MFGNVCHPQKYVKENEKIHSCPLSCPMKNGQNISAANRPELLKSVHFFFFPIPTHHGKTDFSPNAESINTQGTRLYVDSVKGISTEQYSFKNIS
jgi:hypothetical protein